ncbi:MAG: hypothetical protein KKE55_02365, partial [Candidatus Omnitrophica bacterium]|nr:hypothetical protein [Candidatus Omnitrophota bacterium]
LKLACSGLIRLRRIRQPALANLATPSGRSQLILLSWRCSPNPPETRKVVGCASFPSFSRSVSTDYRLLTFYVKRFVLADKVYAFASNFLFVDYLKKKIRTDKLFSLHSFITVT